MKTAKVFKSGNSQAVRLPKEFQLDVKEVNISREGGDLILRPIRKRDWNDYWDGGQRFSPDFPDRIEEEILEEEGFPW